MNLKEAQKQQTHEQILTAAGQLFRTDGYESAGISQIMQSIGLTVGGFYNHFDSKEALLEAVVDHTTSPIVEGDTAVDTQLGDNASTADYVREIVTRYLSIEHRDNPAHGCLLPALSPELSRAEPEVRAAYTRFVRRVTDTVVDNVVNNLAPGESLTKAAAREQALAVVSLCVGGLMLSRAVDDDRLSRQILKACRTAATAIANPDE